MSYYKQFKSGWVPEEIDLEGDWIVRGLFGPLPVRFFGHTKAFTRITHEVFEGNTRFLGQLATGFYEATSGKSQIEPELDVINIDYGQNRNPWIMRGLTDEVRYVAEDKLLGRGIYKLDGFDRLPARNVFWFTVSRQ